MVENTCFQVFPPQTGGCHGDMYHNNLIICCTPCMAASRREPPGKDLSVQPCLLCHPGDKMSTETPGEIDHLDNKSTELQGAGDNGSGQSHIYTHRCLQESKALLGIGDAHSRN